MSIARSDPFFSPKPKPEINPAIEQRIRNKTTVATTRIIEKVIAIEKVIWDQPERERITWKIEKHLAEIETTYKLKTKKTPKKLSDQLSELVSKLFQR
ncbi:MAG: hypothetical protein AAGA18_14735 [Verrucomicrobiota bacterium]